MARSVHGQEWVTARALRHAVGVRRTTVLVASAGDSGGAGSDAALVEACKAADVPCLSLRDLVARIQAANTATATAAAAKKQQQQ